MIDANQGYTYEHTHVVMEAIERLHVPVKVLEQLIHRNNIKERCLLKKLGTIPLAADESLRSLEDICQLIEQKAVDTFNINKTKCGVLVGKNRRIGISLGVG